MFEPSETPARDRLNSVDVAELERTGSLVRDERRRRPLYFDGRFLTARDLTREQNYFLARQADLGRAVGAGVVDGLMVDRDPDSATSVRIAAGLGVTGSGEVVELPQPLSIDLSDVPAIQRLDSAFGLGRLPREAVRYLTGLFLVALRAVEYTANPIASYPTEVHGERSVRDGDIVEAVAVTLVPYAAAAVGESNGSLRAAAAREVFAQQGPPRVSPGMLPLAMVSLQRQLVQWVDPFLVRREISARGDLPGLGLSSRSAAEAYLLQYERHLNDVLEIHGGVAFAASQHFAALPPMGRLPAGTIRPQDFTQIFFPPDVDVELSVVPEDELPVLLEESLSLPPIDLRGPPFESAAVMVLVPIPRHQWQGLLPRLPGLRRPLRSAAPGAVAKRSPLESLRLLKRSHVMEAEDLDAEPWRKVLADHPTLWFLRRRNVPLDEAYAAVSITGSPGEFEPEPPEPESPVSEPPEPEPEPPEPEPPEPEPPEPEPPEPGPPEPEPPGFERDWPPELLEGVLRIFEFGTRREQVLERASATARDELKEFIERPHLRRTPTVLLGLLAELEALERVHAVPARTVMNRYGDPELGTGLLRLEAADAPFKEDKSIDVFSRSGTVPELDAWAREADRASLATLAAELARVLLTESPERVGEFLRERLR